jgi:ribosomal-protein-serine acetyltransferase
MNIETTTRNLTKGDLDALCRWRNHPEVCRFLGNRVKTREETLAWFTRITDDTNNLLKGIMFENRLVGYGIVEDVNRESGKCQVGIVIGEPDAWGKGIGKVVVKELLHHCFATLELNRVLAVVAKGNARSEGLFRSMGFTHEGTLREATLINGHHTDLLCYSMLKKEYKQKKSNTNLEPISGS